MCLLLHRRAAKRMITFIYFLLCSSWTFSLISMKINYRVISTAIDIICFHDSCSTHNEHSNHRNHWATSTISKRIYEQRWMCSWWELAMGTNENANKCEKIFNFENSHKSTSISRQMNEFPQNELLLSAKADKVFFYTLIEALCSILWYWEWDFFFSFKFKSMRFSSCFYRFWFHLMFKIKWTFLISMPTKFVIFKWNMKI